MADPDLVNVINSSLWAIPKAFWYLLKEFWWFWLLLLVVWIFIGIHSVKRRRRR